MNINLGMLIIVGLFLWGNVVFGEGSRELYPENVKGNRAFLVSQPSGSNVFSNQATHYVYAKVNETIAAASSAQNIGSGRIKLTAPDGRSYLTNADNIGQISSFKGSSRQAELVGPRVGYIPFEVQVEKGQEGIWRVEFIPPDSSAVRDLSVEPYNIRADEDWVQHKEGHFIAAWDISVRNTENSSWEKGRVFAPLLHLYLSKETLSDSNGAFYGRNYVLTNDGYIYHVDGNGSHGADFVYFVNSSGFLDGKGLPSYKSRDGERDTVLFHDPNLPDQRLHITHKIFYNLPDTKMPSESIGAVPGQKTWLFNYKQLVEVKNIRISGVTGAGNYLDNKGSFIGLETNHSGRYKLLIKPLSSVHNFKQREMQVEVQDGINSFFWDGLDGDGVLLPKGKDYPIAISVSLIAGEIHFPYLDMEINPKGIIVDRVAEDGTRLGDAFMYWDDSEITLGQPSECSTPLVNLSGSYSRTDGHRWGTYAVSKFINNGSTNGGYGTYSFGNDRAMDTWSYTVHMQEEVQLKISVGLDDKEDEYNTKPIAKDDFFIMTSGSSMIVRPTDNDLATSSELNKESIRILDYPINGTLYHRGNGEWSYQPRDKYIGLDQFTYQIMDKKGNWSNIALAKIDVKGIFIPNTITPNGDLKNDVFEIGGLYTFDRVELDIMDRFGKVIFTSHDYRNDWTVSPNINSGMYFFILKAKKSGEKTLVYKGSLLVLTGRSNFAN